MDIELEKKLNNLQKKIKGNNTKDFSFNVGENLYKKLNNHIDLLKCLDDRSLSKQRWLTEAINEKLKDEDSNPNQTIPRAKTLHFLIKEDLLKKIESRVEIIKNFRTSFSKKLWMLEAIHSKLDREEAKAKQLLEKLKETT